MPPIRWSVVAGIAGSACVAFSGSYTLHPTAPWITHLAAIAGAVGTYLLGLYTRPPGALNGPPPPTLPSSASGNLRP
jgi:hypothetical protein